MLISFQHKFILVSPLKAASTSLEKALSPYAEIKLMQTRYGKHFDLNDIERHFHWIFHVMPLSDFRKISVIRDPVEFVLSLYNSHKHEKFKDDHKIYTGHLSFEQFRQNWMPMFPEQCRSQSSRFFNSTGNFDVDFVIQFETLVNDFTDLIQFLALPSTHLDWENRSPFGLTRHELSNEQLVWIEKKYEDDYRTIEKIKTKHQDQSPDDWELIFHSS